MRIIPTSNSRALERVITRNAVRDPKVVAGAARIVADVRRRGDAALRTWMRRLDGVDPPFALSRADLRAGWQATPREVRRAIRAAAARIRRVAALQVPRPFRVSTATGVRIEQRAQPIASAGCYVPGGRHPLPSTVLMTVIPARVAGVPEVTVACPNPTPAVLCAAVEAGATRVVRLGGAQAIAALAYGTPSVRRVEKIVGPGNAWVAAAKRIVAPDCPIDFDAGPSEVVVWSDAGRPEWIAADLIAQAEHDPDARAILVTTSDALARQVRVAVNRRMPDDGPARRPSAPTARSSSRATAPRRARSPIASRPSIWSATAPTTRRT
ncbi:MAG: histidinol dehydrogenase [Vicinamibacterales bacterium]